MEIRNDRNKGLSYAELGRKYGIDQRTAKRYAESAEAPAYTLKEAKPSKLDNFKGQVKLLLEEAPYSAVRILEKIKEQGFDGKYTIVRRYVSAVKGEQDEKATVRFETMPGLQGQVDWGFFEDHYVEENGFKKKLYCFMMILGYSRERYIEFVTDMNTSTLILCHIIPALTLPEEHLNPMRREYIIDRLKTRRVAKDCMLSFNGNFYSVPAQFALKDVVVVEMNSTLAVYHSGKQIALHKLSALKNQMVLSKEHYASLNGGRLNPSNLLFSSTADYNVTVRDLSYYGEAGE